MQVELMYTKYIFMQTIILVSSFGLFVWEQFFHFAFLLRPNKKFLCLGQPDLT